MPLNMVDIKPWRKNRAWKSIRAGFFPFSEYYFLNLVNMFDLIYSILATSVKVVDRLGRRNPTLGVSHNSPTAVARTNVTTSISVPTEPAHVWQRLMVDCPLVIHHWCFKTRSDGVTEVKMGTRAGQDFWHNTPRLMVLNCKVMVDVLWSKTKSLLPFSISLYQVARLR